MNLIEQLTKYSEKLELAGQDYYKKSTNYAKLEEKFKLIRAKVYNMERVQQQPNQVLRESEADVILQGHEQFKPLYEEYINAKMESKEAWVKYEVIKEINENLRVLVNNLTFMKGGKNE